MPNYVENDLVVSGPVGDLKSFVDFAREGDDLLSANKFIPYPLEFRKQDEVAKRARAKDPTSRAKDGFNSGGYEWCVANWGTKWGIFEAECTHPIQDVDTEDERGPLEYQFRSAWAPALPVIMAMARRFPTLTFDLHYYERGCEFQGHLQMCGTKTIAKTEAPYYGTRGG